MSGVQKILGSWGADLERWADLDPEIAEMPASMVNQTLGGVEVTISADSLVIENFGKPGNREELPVALKEGGGNKVVVEVEPGSEDAEEFEVEILDEEHIILRMAPPDNEDAFALKRAG